MYIFCTDDDDCEDGTGLEDADCEDDIGRDDVDCEDSMCREDVDWVLDVGWGGAECEDETWR